MRQRTKQSKKNHCRVTGINNKSKTHKLPPKQDSKSEKESTFLTNQLDNTKIKLQLFIYSLHVFFI
jgi:hypothetical protein